MRRASVLISVLAVLLVSLVVVAGSRTLPTAAQEGTPPADEELEGVTFEPLGFGTTQELPAAPADLILIRVTLEPGASLPAEADDPEVALIYVESGALTLRIEAPVTIFRAAKIAAFAAGAEEAEITPPEEVAAGTEFTLNQGDSVVLPPSVTSDIRNDGTEPVVGLAAIVAPAEMDEAIATPST